MANRKFYRGTAFCSLERELVFLFGSAVIGAVGAVGTVKGMGIESVVRNSAGNYTITFEDSFKRYLFGNVNFINATGSGIATVEVMQNPATFQSTFTTARTVTIQCYDFAGLAADPAAGSVMGFLAIPRNSSAGPADA